MKSEYDFSNTEQGKFYHSDATFHLPIYLDPDVDEFITELAEEKGIDTQVFINELLRDNIKLIRSLTKNLL